MDDIKKQFKHCGINVKIFPEAKIVNPENLWIGDNVQIDDFALIIAGPGSRLEGHNHIACHVSVIGGGALIMEQFSWIAAGSRIVTGSADFKGEALVGPTIPQEYHYNQVVDQVRLGKHCGMGTGSVALPGARMEDYSVTGALTLINGRLEHAGIYIGIPARKKGLRNWKNLKSMEADLRKKYNYEKVDAYV